MHEPLRHVPITILPQALEFAARISVIHQQLRVAPTQLHVPVGLAFVHLRHTPLLPAGQSLAPFLQEFVL